MRPRGKPPTPSARSTAIEPVEMTSIFSSAAAPSFMIEPFPNCFSICRIAWSIALVFSVTAIPTSQRASRKRTAPACYTPAPSANTTFEPLPVGLVLALRLHDLERHRLHGRARTLFQLALELLIGLLLIVLALGLSATAWHLTSLPSG